MIPPVAINSALLRCGWLAMLAATRKAIGLRMEPQAPPKETLFYGPTAG